MISGTIGKSSQRSRHFGVIAVFCGLLLSSCGTETAPTPQTQSTSTPASSASNKSATASGATVMLGDITRVDSVLTAAQGRWILVNVWATWCRPCVAETPELVALDLSLNERPFSLIGISADYMTSPTAEEAVNKVSKFATQYQIRYPNVIYSGSLDDLTARFSLGGTIPTTILYDPQGKEVERWTGRLVEADFTRIKSLLS